ncbi:MAG TPA: type II secretion system protein GspM [Usitatibacter sp.]|nr:type II secretion system protein GspM [Usitatibacter sp.]
MTRLGDWYAHRGPGERRIIATLVLLVAGAVLLAAALQLHRARERLEQELPALRASIEALERDAAEVRRLRALPAAKPAAATPLASLATNAGGLPGARVSVMDDRRVRLEGADISFSALLEWLQAARATHGMQVESARVESLPAPGRVRAELTLARS